jgi:hypothetical protein
MKIIRSHLLNEQIYEEKIAPGSRASSNALNRLISQFAEDLNQLRDTASRYIDARALLDEAIVASSAVQQQRLNGLMDMLNTLTAGYSEPMVDFHWSPAYASGWFLNVSEAEHSSLFGQITLPISMSISVIKPGGVSVGWSRVQGYNPSDVEVSTSSSIGGVDERGDMEKITDGDMTTAWITRLPVGTRTVVVDCQVAMTAGDTVANCASCVLFPAGNMNLVGAYVRQSNGQWTSLDLSILPRSAGSFVSTVGAFRLWWDPMLTGPVGAVRFLFSPINPNTANLFGLVDVDVRSVRFERSGRFTAEFLQLGDRVVRAVTLLGLNAGYCTYGIESTNKIGVSMSAGSSFVSPVLNGMRILVQ